MGILSELSYPQCMTSYIQNHRIKMFDYSKFAEPHKESITVNAECLAKENI